MKKLALIALTTAAATLVSCSSIQKGSGGPRCKVMSWNPEIYSFYGAPDKLVEKLGKIPAMLSERRAFVEVTEGPTRAEVKLYEQEKGSTYTITQWDSKQFPHLLEHLNKAIEDNQGRCCVGEVIKGVLGKDLGRGKVSKGIGVSASPKGAFAPSVETLDPKSYSKVTVILLC